MATKVSKAPTKTVKKKTANTSNAVSSQKSKPAGKARQTASNSTLLNRLVYVWFALIILFLVQVFVYLYAR